MKTGIFIVPSDLDSLQRKGVLDTALDRDEDGYLDKVITIHPFALETRTLKLAENHVVQEYRQPPSSTYRVISWFRFVLHLIHLTYRIWSVARHKEVSFIRSQDPYFSGLIGYLASCMSGKPFCISIHSDYDKMEQLDPVAGAPRIFGSRKLAKQLEHILLSRADMVLGITEYINRYAVANGADPAKTRVFRHVIDFTRYAQPASDAAVDTLMLPPKRRILSVVCRLSRQKFVYDLIELCKLLRLERNDFTLIMAGNGEEFDNLQRLISEERLQDFVKLPGFLSPEQVAALRQQSDISLALLDGRSLLEACAAGRPVVAYDVEWHREIVVDGVTGSLVREGDVVGLKQAVNRLLEDESLANKLGSQLKQRVFEMYSPSVLLEQRRGAYQSLLQSVS